MKVLHLRSSAGFWGPERQISQLIAPMRRQGFEIAVLVLYRRRPSLPVVHPLVSEIHRQGGRASQLSDRWRRLPSAVVAVAKTLQQEGFALLHTHEYKSDLIGVLASKLVGVPVVASVRGYTDRTIPLRLYKQIDLKVLRYFDRILPVSDHMRDQLLDARLPNHRLTTVYDALDARSFQSNSDLNSRQLRQQAGSNRTSKMVSIVGRLSEEKGHRFFLESIEQISQSFPNVHFLIVGDGPERENLERRVFERGINHIVSFLGYRSDVAAVMAASDILVLSSLREGFGDVLVEAMSLGKPVVATKVGGVPEIVRHTETGLLVPPEDPTAMAQAIVHLLRDSAWAEQLGARGREVMMRNFHIDILARRLAAIYREVLDGE